MKFKHWLLESQKDDNWKKIRCVEDGIIQYWPIFIKLPKIVKYETLIKEVDPSLFSVAAYNEFKTYNDFGFKPDIKDINTLYLYLSEIIDLFPSEDKSMEKAHRIAIKKLFNCVERLGNALFSTRQAYSAPKYINQFVNDLFVVDKIANSNFSEIVLNCFPIDHSVDWRPNETTPEDYYAL